MTRLIIFIAGFVCIVAGCNKISTNSRPFEGQVEAVEKANINDFDYFKLSKGYMLPYAIYEQNEATKNITQFVYPLVSKHYLDSVLIEFAHSTAFSKDASQFGKWLGTVKNKPKIYVKSSRQDLSEAELDEIMNADSTEKRLEGTRLTSFVDLSDKVKEGFEEMGITPENSLFIEEGVTPKENKGAGWLMIIAGIIIVIVSALSFMNKVSNA